MASVQVPAQYQGLFQKAAAQYGVPYDMLIAQGNQESGFNPDARSSAGAEGIMQFMPGTAASNDVNPWDPQSAIDGAAKLMSEYYKQFGSWALALAAYNAGPGAVEQAGNAVPNNPQTQQYVKDIMANSQGTAGQAPGDEAAAAPPAAQPPGATPAAGKDPAVPDMKDWPAVQKYIAKVYPDYAWMLDIPDVKAVLEQAVAGQWDNARTQAAIQQTKWWKTTSGSVKKYEQLRATNPAEVEFKPGTQAEQALATVEAAAASSPGGGMRLTEAQARQLALQDMEFGWDSSQLQAAIGRTATTIGPNANAEDVATALRNIETQYQVQLPPGQLQDWVKEIVGGTRSEDQFTQGVRAQAETKYAQSPQMLQALRNGFTPVQLLSSVASVKNSQASAHMMLSPGQQEELGLQALQENWTGPQLQQHVASLLTPTDATGLIAQVKNMAQTYGLTPSPSQIDLWARQMAGGTADSTAIGGEMLKMARAKFTAQYGAQSPFISLMDAGYTPRQILTSIASVRAEQSAGVSLSAPQIQELAQRNLEGNFTADQLSQATAALVNPTDAGGVYQNLANMASNYMVAPTQQQLNQWASETVAGTTTTAKIQAQLADMAAAKFPTWRSMILAGFTPVAIQSNEDQIKAEAGSLNISLTTAQVDEITQRATLNHWQAPQIQQAIGQQLTYAQPTIGSTPRPAVPNSLDASKAQGAANVAAPAPVPGSQPTGNANADILALTQQAAQYYQQPSAQVLQSWAQRIAEGTATQAQFNALMAQHATQRWPDMADQIMAGYTPYDITDNLRTQAANLLEVNPTQINFMENPAYAKILDGGQDGSMMTYSQEADYVRAMPAFANTVQARNTAANLETELLQSFGKVAS